MLISPLMGPIMGIGFGMGINDILLLRKALLNYFIATGVALMTSTIFFLISPINDAHSEILARTSPNIYDVLIALFGGLAGIVVTSSKLKGNVIPGVAIATALMPPLCTAGYGLATFQLRYFVGAFYLFVINTVFIALATFIFVRVMKFPLKHLQNKRSEKIAERIVWTVVLVTLLPSLYFGYDIVQQDRFKKSADHFISNETHLQNDYLLNKQIDAKAREITLVFGGKEITPEQIEQLKRQLPKYKLDKTTLQIKQGFSYLNDNKINTEQNDQYNRLTQALAEKDKKEDSLLLQLDTIRKQPGIARQLFAELKTLYPTLRTGVLQPAYLVNDSNSVVESYLVILASAPGLKKEDRIKIDSWLKVRTSRKNIHLIFQDYDH